MFLSGLFCFLDNFIFIVIPALALFRVLDADAVWWSFLIGESINLLTICIIAAVKKHGFPFRAKDFLFLPAKFGVPQENVLDFTITDKEQIVSASASVSDFCLQKGATEKQSMLLALFVEELSANIVLYGFSDGKSHSIDVRVLKNDDAWTLRVRDDCKRFDPVEWIKLHENDDKTKNIGIRMVCGMAKNVQYLSTMELNNIILSI